MKIKRRTVIVMSILFVSTATWAQQNDLLSKIEHTTSIDTYFTNLTVPVLSWAKDFPENMVIIGNANVTITGTNGELNKVATPDNMNIGYVGYSGGVEVLLPVIHPSFAVSGFFLWMFDELSMAEHTNTGGGIVYRNEFLGSLGFYAGWMTTSSTGSGSGLTDSKVHFNLVPLLDTSATPVVKYVIKEIGGYFGYVEDKTTNFAVQPFFNEWKAGPLYLDSIYCRDQGYDPYRRSREYGGKGGIIFEGENLYFTATVEGGYRQYHDFDGPAAFFYDDTPYVRPILELGKKALFEADVDEERYGVYLKIGADFDKENNWAPKVFLEANMADVFYTRVRFYRSFYDVPGFDVSVSISLPMFESPFLLW
jgi:hypothetical protein